MFRKYKDKEADLYFENVCVSYGLDDGIRDVTGSVKGGELLGVFGPKGCGKTTLLTALSGLSPVSRGEVRVGVTPIERSPGKVSYCPAVDIFLPTITVAETLKYAAKLHMRVDLSTSSISRRVVEAIDLLQLDLYRNCMVQFLDGAARKRLSIACAMLTSPSVLLLDEPLLGLPFAETLNLLKLLRLYVEKTARGLVIATSTCPGVVYQSCSKYLFLYRSKMAYSGTPQELDHFMRDAGLCCSLAYNPAEYFLELLCEETLDDNKPVQDKITAAFWDRKNTKGSSSNGIGSDVTHEHALEDSTRQHNGVGKSVNSKSTPEIDEAVFLIEDDSEMSVVRKSSATKDNQKWSSPYWREFLVLLDRNFHNARRRILFPVGMIQNLYILVICVLIWWRPDRNEDTVKDRLGLFFFTVVQWAFFALLDAILTFPKEMKVINRERTFGRYRLSAYCLSKTLSELPLAILQPCIFMCVIYWVANLNGAFAFLASQGVLILNVMAAQSIGLFVGTALQPPWTISVVSLGLLSMMLWGGAFNTPPPWLHWGKFASFFYYGLNALIYLEFTDAPPIKCLADSPYHTVPVCTIAINGTNTTIPEFPSDILLEPLGVDWPLWAYVTVLAGIMVVTRLLWYILLRRKKLD
ncbi:ABC transporter G family member 22-like [Pecten maximus]|uniref:ABC transporter G family member 22-like n=1 Tax=Pecten maximus TaxID=6579 RepID=UPI00145896DF|nr:ABC transporter G family member 22-like [Pecten maximus]